MRNQTAAKCLVKGVNEKAAEITFNHSVMVIDRDSEVILPKGIDYSDYALNPVFLWSHNKQIPAIGRMNVDRIKVTEKAFEGPVSFDVDNDPFAEMIFGKYAAGILNAVSIGFLVKEISDPVLDGQRGATISKSVLLESSAVCVPANQMALRKEYEAAKKAIADEDYAFNYYKAVIDLAKMAGIEKEYERKAWLYVEKSFAGDDAEPEEAQEKMHPRSTVSHFDGSYEWVRENLDKKLYRYIKQQGMEIAEHEAYPDIIATFDDHALFCIINWLELPDMWRKYRASWGMVDGSPEWSGEPQEVQISLAVMDKHLRRYEYHPIPAPEDYSNDRAKADGRLSDLMRKCSMRQTREIANHEIKDFEHHDILSGEFVTVWKNVAAAMMKLLKDENMTAEEKRPVYDHLAMHYREFNQEPPSFDDYCGNAAPGEDSAGEKLTELLRDDLFRVALINEITQNLLKGEIEDERTHRRAVNAR